jgi:hypothetical protein
MFLIPFKGRNSSGISNVNFLWKSENIYIMDNHICAAWCWARYLNNQTNFGLIHIDKHCDWTPHDSQQLGSSFIMPSLPLQSMRLKEYLSLEATRWDNYLTIFLHQYGHYVIKLILATHNLPNKLCNERANTHIVNEEWEIPRLPSLLKISLNSPLKWIVNIDLDYFFTTPDCIRFQSDEYIDDIANTLKLAIKKNKILCLSIALSPEFCGKSLKKGWRNSESICNRFSNLLNLNFKLPTRYFNSEISRAGKKQGRAK